MEGGFIVIIGDRQAKKVMRVGVIYDYRLSLYF